MAVKYLMQGGFSKQLAERLVNYVGGRCIYLVNSLIYRACAILQNLNVENGELYEMMIKNQLKWRTEKQLVMLRDSEPLSSLIIEAMTKGGEITVAKVVQNKDNQERKAIQSIITRMVIDNILRYTNIHMKWHGKPQQLHF